MLLPADAFAQPVAISTVEISAEEAILVPSGFFADPKALKILKAETSPTGGCIVVKPVGVENYNKVFVDSNRRSDPLFFTESATAIDGATSNTTRTFYSCSVESFSKIIVELSTMGNLGTWIIWAYSYIVYWIIGVLSLLTMLFGSMLTSMIGQGQFVTSNLVQEAWPFVQGIANLGFIIALLFIAFATTLRLDSVGTSVQRLLPKLLIAALLVNFSLVIGGLLIDMSRVVMAAEMQLMSGGTVTSQNFTTELLKKTKAVNSQLHNIRSTASANSFGAIMTRMTQEVAFIALLTVAFGIIAINMFVRYIALLILLILSPLAYLALALPQTTGYAKMWWGMFIKWVAYGPIVLFFLMIIIQIQNINISLPQDATNSGDDWKPYFDSIVHFVMIISLFFVANSLSKKSAGVGSDMAMGFATKTGAWARKNPKTAMILGGAATGGTGLLLGAGAAAVLGGGQYADKRLGYQEARKIKKAGKAKEEQERLEKTAPAMAAKYKYGTQEYKNDIDNAKAIKNAGNNAADPALGASKLWGANTGKAITEDQMTAILARPLTMVGVDANDQQLRAMVGNTTIVSKMTDAQRITFNTTVTNAMNTGTTAEKEVARQMLTAYTRSMSEANRKSSIPATTP